MPLWSGRGRAGKKVTAFTFFRCPTVSWPMRNAMVCAKNTHYDDVIMDAIASQITSLTIVYSYVYSGADQSKHQSSASLAFVWGIHRGPVNSPHKWPVTRKMFPSDDHHEHGVVTGTRFTHFCHRPFVRWNHWSPVDFPHKGTVIRNDDVFSAINLQKLLNKLSSCQWSYKCCPINETQDTAWWRRRSLTVTIGIAATLVFQWRH